MGLLDGILAAKEHSDAQKQLAIQNQLMRDQMSLTQEKWGQEKEDLEAARNTQEAEANQKTFANQQVEKNNFLSSFSPVKPVHSALEPGEEEAVGVGAKGPGLLVPDVQNPAGRWHPVDLTKQPWEELPGAVQDRVIDEYKKNAPKGVNIGPSDVIQAYRQQQLVTRPAVSADSLGLHAISAEGSPGLAPSKVTYGPSVSGGGFTTPDKYNEAAGSYRDKLSGHFKDYEEQVLPNVFAAESYATKANEPGHVPGSYDKALLTAVLKTIAPAARVNDKTGEGLEQLPIHQELINKFKHVFVGGSILSPEEREGLVQLAHTSGNARYKAAAQSAYPTAQAALSQGVKPVHMGLTPRRYLDILSAGGDFAPDQVAAPQPHESGLGAPSTPGDSTHTGSTVTPPSAARSSEPTATNEVEYRALAKAHPGATIVWAPEGETPRRLVLPKK